MRQIDYTKLGDKSWDSEILGYVAQIHEHKGKQELFCKQKPQELTRLIEIAKVQSTEASNKIEGIVTTSLRVKQLFADKTTPKTRDEEEIMGYRDVLNTIHENYEYIRLKDSFILQLHRDLYKFSEKSIGGKFKNTQNYISETRQDGTTFVRFVPLAPFETPEAVNLICESFNRVVDSCEIDTLILIPTFIIDFLCIHPFNDGNGRMSRLLTTLLLYKSGYVVGKYISLENKIEKTKNHYYDALQESSDGWIDGNNDPTSFIKYILSIILSAYRDFEDRLDIVRIKRSSTAEAVRLTIANKIGKFTKNELMELCPSISKASIENALKQFIRSGFIIKHGNGKTTFYTKVEI